MFTKLTKHLLGTVPHAEYQAEHDKVQLSGSLPEWRQKKKSMIPDSDNAIKYKGWHVRRCQGGLFAKWVIREGDIGAKCSKHLSLCSKQRDS